MVFLQDDESAVQSPPLYSLVSTAEDFQSMRETLQQVSRLAIDIEADSLYHYFEKVCLIQISSDSDTYILDPLVLTGIQELAPIMADPSVEKVFHASGYDLYCLRRDYGFVFTNIFDTHIAAQLLGYEYLGLSAIMEKLLGIHHSKRRQRDDWSRRPLASEQLEYAAMDTHHLLRLRDALEKELLGKDRLSWAQEEFEAAASIERRDKEFDVEGFRRIKGSRTLSPRDQTILKALYLFRDQIARKLDVPPFKVMNNATLIDLVENPPQSVRSMFNRAGISRRVARKFSSDILNTIAEARQQNQPVPEAPVRNNFKPPNRAVKQRLDTLKGWRQKKAEELNLHVGVVFPANLLENLAGGTVGGQNNLLLVKVQRVKGVKELLLNSLRAA